MDNINSFPNNNISNKDDEKDNLKNEEIKNILNNDNQNIFENNLNDENINQINENNKDSEVEKKFIINEEINKIDEKENNSNKNNISDSGKNDEGHSSKESNQKLNDNGNNNVQKDDNTILEENNQKTESNRNVVNNINIEQMKDINIIENEQEEKNDILKRQSERDINIDEKKRIVDINQINDLEENLTKESEQIENEEARQEENKIISNDENKSKEEKKSENKINDFDLKNSNEINNIDNYININQIDINKPIELEQEDLYNHESQKETEETNEFAKRLFECKEEKKEMENGEENKKKINEKSDIRLFFQKEERKKKIENYYKSTDELLDSLTMDWLAGDRNSYITNYEYKYMIGMNDLFNKVNEDLSIKDDVVCKIFQFICNYCSRRKDILNEIPWVEINNIRKILVKDNFEGICVLNNDNLLIEKYQELILLYAIEKTEDNIIEYNNNIFFKYLLEFLFRNGFFESFLEKAYSRDDEIFYGQVENAFPDELPSFYDEFINLIIYPMQVFSYCKKDYLIKMNYCEKFISKFLMKIESFIKCSSIKEGIKKQFFNIIAEKYKLLIENMFNNFDENKDKNNPIWEKFSYYILIIAENYLTQQKLESRIYGLNLITQLTEVFKNENQSGQYANKLQFVKESIIKYMTKIDIYNLIFGENIHEALVHRAYNLLSFLYKNNAFNSEQIKHLWSLSQDKYQTISDSIIELFGKLLPEFSIEDSNEILDIVSEMNLSEVNEITLKLLENFFNSKEKNDKLYKILYKFSDELTMNEGLNKNIIIKSRSILVKLLFNQIYTKDLINIIKKCIFNIGKNYLVNTSLSMLKLIFEHFHSNENSQEVRIIFSEINPNIHNFELLIKYLEKKGNLFSVLFTSILDNAHLILFLLEEIKSLNQLINNIDNFDSELAVKLDEMYKKFIDPENGYYYNYGLNGHIQGQNINVNPVRQISSNILDKTQSTEKSLNEGLIGEEEDNDGNNQNIINNNEDIFNNDPGNWEMEINPEKYFKNIFKEFILFLKKISKKDNMFFISEKDLIDKVFNQFEFPFNNKNYYQNISELLENVISFFSMGKIQIQIGYFKYLYEILIHNGVSNKEKIIYYKFLNEILKKQEQNKNILLISDKVLTELVLDKSLKYDILSINQLPFEAFEFLKLFIIYFNQKHGNIYYSNATKKITSIQKYDLLAGIHILENYFIYTKDDKVYSESLDLLTNILNVASEKLTNRKKILDKIFDFLTKNLNKIKREKDVKTQIIREIKLISIINSTKVKDFYDEEDKNSIIQINIVNKLANFNDDIENLNVNKYMKIKDLKNEIMNKIILSEKNINIYNQRQSLENLSINFSADDIKQELNKKGINIRYKDQDLDDNSTLNDYNVANDDVIQITENIKKMNQIMEIQIPEERLNEECSKIKGIFSSLDEEIIKLSIKKNNCNTEETIMFLTEEKNINNLKKEIEEKKKKEKIEMNKKAKKEEENIIPLEEDKINLLFEILNQEDNLINVEIWKLLGSIKYPDNIINIATSEELMNIISEPNLYKMLLNIKLVNSLIFDDKFCKYNKISQDKKLNWTSNFIKNESFVNSILNKMNNIGEIKEKNEIILELKDENEEKLSGEKQVLKFQILSIFSNWFHNIFINILDLIKNKYIQSIENDLKQCSSFTLYNQNDGNQNNINNINNDDNNDDAQHKIGTINEKDAKKFLEILAKNNIVKIFYKIVKISTMLSKEYKKIIQLVLEMLLIYFGINKQSIKFFLEEETNNKSFCYLISSEKNKDIRILIFNFFKILVKNLNIFETKKIIKKREEINNIININEINSRQILIKDKEKENKINKEEKINIIQQINQINNEKEKQLKDLNNLKSMKEEDNAEKDDDKVKEQIKDNCTIQDNEVKNEENEYKRNANIEFYNINEIDNNQESSPQQNQNENIQEGKKENNEIIEEIENDEIMLFKILLNLYKDKILVEDLFSQELYILYSFLLTFKEILYKEKEKNNFIISQEISFFISHICKYIALSGEEFIQKKYNIMYNIYLLSSCCKYYTSLIKYHLQKNSEFDLVGAIYDCLFGEIKTSSNITSYRFDWENLRKHSYNLLSNIIFLDNKYINKWLPKILNYRPFLYQEKIQMNIDFKLRDPIHDKLIGLKNFGATCYLNSLFQQMFMNPLFSTDLLSFDFSTKNNIDLKSSVIYNMQLGFANLRYSCLGVYPPIEFIKSFKKAFNGQPIQFGIQQDSDEFLSILCDELEKEAKAFGKENFLNNSFKGKISNEIVSLNKEYPYYSKTDEDFYRITLDIKGHKNLEEALDAYIKGEILDGDNQYYVDKYKKKLPIRKSSSLKILGNQVIVHLKRFEFDFVTFTNKKLNDYLQFPFEINFKKWTRAYLRSTDPNLKPELLNITDEEKDNLDEEKMNYVLTGILIHSGSSLQSGHYYSLIIDQESGLWYQFNDNNITEFNIERDLEKECFGIKGNIDGEQFGRTAYLLFYTKKSLFRNEKILKGININQNIINEVHKENIKYLKIKTYSNNLYQDFLIKLINNCFANIGDTNNEREYSINKKYREQIKIYEAVQNVQKLEEKKEKYENINEIAEEKESKIPTKEIIIPENIVEIIENLKNEDNKKSGVLKIKEFTNKKVIKSLIHYTFGISIFYFDSNAKIASLINAINTFIATNKIYCISILKDIDKFIDVILNYIFSCGVKSQDMQNISQEIFDLFKNIFQNVYIYEKENLSIISKKFSYISKNKNSNKYEINEEYESCLLRSVKNIFCKNLERCRKEYSKDLMFLHLLRFCSGSFPEISIILEDYLILLISFITNNKLSDPLLKSKENPSFYMGGNQNWKPNENYEIIFCDIILHSINEGMYLKKKLSPYFIKENPNYIIQKKSEINEIEMFEYYPRLPKILFAMLSPQFIFDFINAKNCTIELIGNLFYENEKFSNFFLKTFNTYLKELNKNYEVFENVFNKVCSIFKLNDSLNEQRLEKLFGLGDGGNENQSLFDYFNSVKEQSNYILDFIYILTTVMIEYNCIFDYLNKYKEKITWIYYYFNQIKTERSSNRSYNVVNALHPDFLEIIEEGLINRLEFEPKIELVNDVNDDDGFNLI